MQSLLYLIPFLAISAHCAMRNVTGDYKQEDTTSINLNFQEVDRGIKNTVKKRNGDILPDSSTNDLGSPDSPWANGYVNHIYVSSITVTNPTSSANTAKAWVAFTSTGTVTIFSSFNVTSITDNGTGDFNINFSNPMSNENYAICGASAGNAGPNIILYEARSVNSVRISVRRASTEALQDSSYISLVVFGD